MMGQTGSSSVQATVQGQAYLTQAIKLLEDSIDSNNVDTLRNLLEETIVANGKLSTSALLHKAASSGNVQCLRILLDHGLQVDATDKSQGMTPLHYACLSEENIAKLILLLKEHNAPLNHLGSSLFGRTPLHVAIHQENQEAVETLIKCGCQINVVSECDQGISPLLLAVRRNSWQVFKLLLAGGAGVHKCWMWKTAMTPPIDVLSHRMTHDIENRTACIQMFRALLQADGDLTLTLCQMPKGQQTKVGAVRTYSAIKTILDRLGKHYQKQAHEFLICLIYNGYRPRGESVCYLKQWDPVAFEVLEKYISSPPSLRDLSVRVVRRSMRYNVIHGLWEMKQLSSQMRQSILMRNMPGTCLIWT